MCEMIFTSDKDFFDTIGMEETKRKNETIKNYKQITNFENTKKILENITLELPEVPKISDIKKIMINRDEKVFEKIIKPKDELILELHKKNLALNKELSKQAKTVDIATRYENEYAQIIEKNANLRLSNSLLKEELENKEKELELQFESKFYNIERDYKKEIHKLKEENKNLNKMIDKFKVTLKRFIKWICHKFSYPSEDELVRDFEKKTYTNFNFEKQLDINQFKKKDDDFDIEY